MVIDNLILMLSQWRLNQKQRTVKEIKNQRIIFMQPCTIIYATLIACWYDAVSFDASQVTYSYVYIYEIKTKTEDTQGHEKTQGNLLIVTL